MYIFIIEWIIVFMYSLVGNLVVVKKSIINPYANLKRNPNRTKMKITNIWLNV